MVGCLYCNIFPKCNHVESALRFPIVHKSHQESNILICKRNPLPCGAPKQRPWRSGRAIPDLITLTSNELAGCCYSPCTILRWSRRKDVFFIWLWFIYLLRGRRAVGVHGVAAQSDLMFIAVSAPGVKSVVGCLHSNSFAYLA